MLIITSGRVASRLMNADASASSQSRLVVSTHGLAFQGLERSTEAYKPQDRNKASKEIHDVADQFSFSINTSRGFLAKV